MFHATTLTNYITTTGAGNFQPMNITFGLLPSLDFKNKKDNRKIKLAERALKTLNDFANERKLI